MNNVIRLLCACALSIFSIITVRAQVDPNFHIYISFGQSNMEGQGQLSEEDLIGISPRYLTLSATDYEWRNRAKGEWYPATPPLCREDLVTVDPTNRGLGPTDYFGRTMVENTPENVRIGVICVAVGASAIEGFVKDKGVTQNFYNNVCWDWLREKFYMYDYYAYQHIVNLARRAQKNGVIKGILIHQGESNWGQTDWPQKVRQLYYDLLSDLGLKAKDVPLLVGEVVEKGPSVDMNQIIRTIPSVIPTGHVVSSAGVPEQPGDEIHFSPEGYREMGRRYAKTMLEIEGYEMQSAPEVDDNVEPTVGKPVDMTARASTHPAAWEGMTAPYYYLRSGLSAEFYAWNTEKQGVVMHQKITGLPNGYYTVMLEASSSFTSGRGFDSPITEEGGEGRTFLFANDVDLMLPVVDMGNNLVYEPPVSVLSDVPVTDGTLDIGLRRDKVGANWDVIQIKKIWRNTEGDVTPLLNLLKETEQRAAIYSTSSTLPSVFTDALHQTFSDNKGLTAEEIKQDIFALEDILQKSSATSRAYRYFQFVLKDIKNVYDVPQYVEYTDGAHEIFRTAIDDAINKADAATDAADVDAQTEALRTALYNYVANASPAEGYLFDLTCMLTNPDLTPFLSWKKIDGWFTDQIGGNSNSMSNNNVISTTGLVCFYEYWNPTPPTNGFLSYQQLMLPLGTYRTTALAFARDGSGKTDIYLRANNTSGTSVKSDVLADAQVEFEVSTPETVKIGLFANAANTATWSGIGYMHLYKLPTLPTGIEIVTEEASKPDSFMIGKGNGVYDLQGRRIADNDDVDNHLQNGFYIMGNHKILVR